MIKYDIKYTKEVTCSHHSIEVVGAGHYVNYKQ